MIETPWIEQTEPATAAVIRLTLPRDQMMRLFGPAVGELMAVLASQGIAPAGPVFAHHLKMSPGLFDFELGVPVAAPVQPSGRVNPGELPAARVARTIYSGPYEGLPRAWGAFTAWMEANGCEQADDLWEVYTVGPQASPDPADWRTQLTRPLKG